MKNIYSLGIAPKSIEEKLNDGGIGDEYVTMMMLTAHHAKLRRLKNVKTYSLSQSHSSK
jgi:hypothetical protein